LGFLAYGDLKMTIKSRMEEQGYTHEEIEQVLEELSEQRRRERLDELCFERLGIREQHPRASTWPFPVSKHD